MFLCKYVVPRVMVKKVIHHIKHAAHTFRQHSCTLVVSAVGIVAGLLWQDAIKSTLSYFYPGSELTNKYVIAILFTAIAVLITYLLSEKKT